MTTTMPHLWQGLNPWKDNDVMEHQCRAETYYDEVDRTGERPLMPGREPRDLRIGFNEPEARDVRRLPVLLDDFEEEHTDRHGYYEEPFCRSCRPDLAELSLRRWLTRNPGRTPPRDSWDGTISTAPATPPAAKRSPYLTASQLRELPPAAMLFGEVVPQDSLGYVSGRDGSYKTFLALDLCLHLITGRDWHGRPLAFGESGAALFVAGEGVRSFHRRIDAWTKHHGIAHDVLVQTGINAETGLPTWGEPTGERAPGLSPWQEDRFIVRDGAVDLFAGADAFAELLDFVKVQQPNLLIVDTLNASAGAAEQNSASDMSVITSRIRALKTAAGPDATVIVCAHTTKTDADVRGSSAIEDDADFVLHCRKDEDRLRIRIAKMKDGESGQDVDLKAVNVGESLVLVAAKPEPMWASDDIAHRIRQVLYNARDLDAPTATQILAILKDDGTNKPAGKAMVHRLLGDLQSEGQISVAGTTGKGVTAAKRWKLNKSAYPPDER